MQYIFYLMTIFGSFALMSMDFKNATLSMGGRDYEFGLISKLGPDHIKKFTAKIEDNATYYNSGFMGETVTYVDDEEQSILFEVATVFYKSEKGTQFADFKEKLLGFPCRFKKSSLPKIISHFPLQLTTQRLGFSF